LLNGSSDSPHASYGGPRLEVTRNLELLSITLV